MERYTEILDYEASNLSPDDDMYEEKLLGITFLPMIRQIRRSNQGLTSINGDYFCMQCRH